MLNALRPLLLLAALAVATPVLAQEAPVAPAAAAPIEIRSQREDAGARVRQVERAGGRVLQAEPMQRGGREVYRFKVLTPEGRVRVMQGDPRDARPDAMPREDRRGGGERIDRRRDLEPGFDRSSELTARRREFRDDGRGDSGRARETRPPPAPERGGGRPARD